MFALAVMSTNKNGLMLRKNFSRLLNELKKVAKMEKFHSTSARIVILSIHSANAIKLGKSKDMPMLKCQGYVKNLQRLARELIVSI